MDAGAEAMPHKLAEVRATRIILRIRHNFSRSAAWASASFPAETKSCDKETQLSTPPRSLTPWIAYVIASSFMRDGRPDIHKLACTRQVDELAVKMGLVMTHILWEEDTMTDELEWVMKKAVVGTVMRF
jgi:hypothetical protein